MTGGIVVFRQAVAQLVAAGEEQQRIVAAGDQDRAGLAGGIIFVADLPALLAGRNVDRDVVLVVHHAAIGGGVDPAAVGIAHDHEIVGADVAAAVLLVQERHREFQEVDRVVAVDVLEHRAGAHRLGRDRLVRLHALAIGLHHVERAGRHRQAHRDREPLRRIGRAGDQPHALRIARHVLEQDRRRLRPGMVHDLAERAHFEMRVGALDAHDFAGFLGALDELAQILVRRVVGVEALRGAFFQHG